MRPWSETTNAIDGCKLGPMRADEVDTLKGWAAEEGWNPGRGDIAAAWEVEPEAFIALRRGEELVGGGTILSNEGAYGFMGLFIVRSDERSQGLGRELWHYRRDLLLSRLKAGAAIGMDGVFAMAPFYERGGFRLAYRNLRFEGMAQGESSPNVMDGSTLPFEEIDRYDRLHHPAPRPRFLREWLSMPRVMTAAVMEGSRMAAFGALRPCLKGWRFGPVYADRSELGERIVSHLMAKVAGDPIQLDAPETNEAAMELARRHRLQESFGCARMYYGPTPEIPVERIFGVTSFEFG